MSTALASPNIEVIETFDGVRYVLHTSNESTPFLSVFLSIVVRVPLVAAVLAVWLLWNSLGLVSGWLIAAAALFVAQMLFVVRVPWNLFRGRLWQTLISAFGRNEIELRGGKLLLGSRVGFLWSGSRKAVKEFRRIVVYVYQSNVAAQIGEQTETAAVEPRTERAVLAIETGGPAPWLLTDGYLPDETLELAEDLHRRLTVSGHTRQPLPEPSLQETQQDALYPPLAPDFYRRRQPFWLAVHICGTLGLVALTAIAMKTGAWQTSRTKTAIIVGWLLELFILGVTLSLRRPSFQSTAAGNDNAG